VRKIDLTDVVPLLVGQLMETGFQLDQEMLDCFQRAEMVEDMPLAKDVIRALQTNAAVAAKERIPLCQDTGLVVCFAEVGYDIALQGMTLQQMLDQAIRKAWGAAYFRPSIVEDPLFHRINTTDNTPAIVHMEMVPGNELRLHIACKGGGSENMSQLRMMKPADGREGIIRFAVETVQSAGANPCPPILMGIGIGGNFETCALLAKKALFKPIAFQHPMEEYAHLEQDILKAVNETHIGPNGLGGNTTALAVHINAAPCHIASLPVAINMQCHAHRHFCLTI